ncbi:MAG: hypothetical protein ABIG71_01625 [Candidatus Uhrbacteria bacterium]
MTISLRGGDWHTFAKQSKSTIVLNDEARERFDIPLGVNLADYTVENRVIEVAIRSCEAKLGDKRAGGGFEDRIDFDALDEDDLLLQTLEERRVTVVQMYHGPPEREDGVLRNVCLTTHMNPMDRHGMGDPSTCYKLNLDLSKEEFDAIDHLPVATKFTVSLRLLPPEKRSERKPKE